MSVDEALVVLKKCIKEVQTRMIISQPKFTIKVRPMTHLMSLCFSRQGALDCQCG